MLFLLSLKQAKVWGGVRGLVIFMKTILHSKYEDIISVENLLSAWQEFFMGKRNKRDVQEFQFNLMNNILSLHRDLSNHAYKHDGYEEFKISDPKPRIIHKASVRDRLLHRAVYRILYPFFDKTFIADSFSCRNDKGTHKAINRFREFAHIVSKNNTKTCWVLKCDVRKFFASIDQDILLKILEESIKDERIVDLLSEIVSSFDGGKPILGLPLGNLTSQLFSNVYMNEFDQFVKHNLKAKYYIRYADDFVILSEDKNCLTKHISLIKNFMQDKLSLTLHPDKIFIKTLFSGIDFLGWVHFKAHRVLRSRTKIRMFKKMLNSQKQGSVDSYLGLFIHGNSYKIREKLLKF